MRIVKVHNRHAHPGGMEVIFAATAKVLRDHGDDVIVVEKDNKDIAGLAGKLTAFGSMVYSPGAKREMAKLLAGTKPDLVHLYNIYPQFSPAIIDACREANVPVVMGVHDYKLTCPTAAHLRHGTICEKCIGGREYWCAIHNCRRSRSMSLAYAVRNIAARVSGKIHDGVDRFLCVSQFVADLLVRGGYPLEKIRVVHNFVDLKIASPRTTDGDYIACVGRISPEKGLDVLIDAARQTGLPVKIAGDPSHVPGLLENLPGNVECVGVLDRTQLPGFLSNARMMIVPSKWYEAFGLVAIEAMAYRLPVIASAIGGLPEVVRHGVDGLCVPPGDAAALTNAMQTLWTDRDRARAMGEAGVQRAANEFSPTAYYRRLNAAYREAIESRTSFAAEALPPAPSLSTGRGR